MEYQKTAVVTGVASGIGMAAAGLLAQNGIRVIGVARNKKRCEQTAGQLYNAGIAEILPCDLSSQTGIRALAADLNSRLLKVDMLIHCAGMQQSHFMTTEDGLEMQFAVNHLAPFILTHALFPSLKKSKDARIIVISSVAHRHTRLNFDDIQLKKGYTGYRQYKRTKLMNALFAVEFNRRFAGENIRAFAVDPGYVNTRFGEKGLTGLEGIACRMVLRRGAPPETPAKTILYAATEAEALRAGVFYLKDCGPLVPDPYVYHEDAAKKLWALSERFGMTGEWKGEGGKTI